MSDAKGVLGKVNYTRARELTQKLQATLRTIKSRQRDIVPASDPSERERLELRLDEDLGEAVEETIEILDFLHENGFEDVIYRHKEELAKGFTRRSLPPYEKEIFVSAGFSEDDFNEFVSIFELHGHEIVGALEKSGGVASLKARLRALTARDKGRRYRKAKAYLKIGAGGLAIVGDGTAASLLRSCHRSHSEY
jgi:hypothetical protein